MSKSTIYFGVLIMVLILIFSLVHLAVGIAIVVIDNNYGDIFRPEVGLSAGVIGLGFIAILVGTVGLFSILTNRKNLGKFQFMF
jgi:hypothetical protein